MQSREEALARAKSLLGLEKSRVMVGIFGKPGVGKTTLTDFLAKHLPRESVKVVSMDGFHLSNAVLDSLGLSATKGAPNTFDVEGFTQLLKRIRNQQSETIYYPIFHREMEESIAAEGQLQLSVKLVFVEGNYLCHDQDGWSAVAQYFDETWYLSLNDELRIERLINRHVGYGKSPEFAREWTLGTDEKNAQVIERGAGRADFTVNLGIDSQVEES